jgi:O-antigen ligase
MRKMPHAGLPTFSDRLIRWLPALDPYKVQTDFERQFERDAIGHRLHVALACLWCFCCSWPTSTIEIAQLPVILYALLRLTNTHRMTNSIALQPVMLALVLLAIWSAITLAWSPSVSQGLDDLSVMRWCWCIWLLWPVMDRREWLIVALAAGFVPGLIVQAMHVAGIDLGLSWLRFTRPPGRYSGWWDPAVGGSLLVAGLGLHIPAAMLGQGRTRFIGIIGMLTMILGVLATGTRGAWIASALLVLAGTAVAAWMAILDWRPRGRVDIADGAHQERGPGRLGIVSKLALLIAVLLCVTFAGWGAWRALGPGVLARVQETRAELDAASRGDLSTFTGGRVLMAREALSAFASHPIAGVGLGGFETWAREHLFKNDPQAETRYTDRLHAHAHNTALHLAATTGIVGVAIGLLILLAAIIGATHRHVLPARASWGTYRAGPAFALLGLVLVSAFDTLHVNSQTMAILCTLLALSLIHPPRGRGSSARLAPGPPTLAS